MGDEVDINAHVHRLLEEARRTNERRLAVLAGDGTAVGDAARQVLDRVEIPISDTVVVSENFSAPCEGVPPDRSDQLMGAEVDLLVLDARDGLPPNAMGRAIGAVVGGGLILFLCPPLDTWAGQRDSFDRSLVVEPYTLEDVTGWFKQWIVQTLRGHSGVSVIDVDAMRTRQEGLTGTRAARNAPGEIPIPADRWFPEPAYRRCLTTDQGRALQALEALQDPPAAVVLHADRGRGKSSVAGLAAGALAADGQQVAITAPRPVHAAPLLTRARELLGDLKHQATTGELNDPGTTDITTNAGGRVRYVDPASLLDETDAWDAVFADEAAGLPVPTLRRILAIPRVVCTTTLHGYEGGGHGFETRFMAALSETPHAVTEITLSEPIRYARDDPIERWLNRALFLDARPAVEQTVADAAPDNVEWTELAPRDVLSDPEQFREAIGLLAMAHYRTEPNDVARLLDAPNLSTAALVRNGRIACVALIAEEGNLAAERQQAAYRGERLRGNLVPDVFVNEYRRARAAGLGGLRVVRIATHPVARRQGLATRLLTEIRDRWGHDRDWLAAGYGATSELVPFWATNGLVPIFLSASRNDRSGAHSVIMIEGLTPAGRDLVTNLAEHFPRRLQGSLPDVHRDVDVSVVRAVLRAVPARVSLDLDPSAWRFLAAVGFGPGRYDLNPEPTRQLIIHYLTDDSDTAPSLEPADERLLIGKALQGRSWDRVTTDGAFASVRTCRQAFRTVMAPLIATYGPALVRSERNRLQDTGSNEDSPE